MTFNPNTVPVPDNAATRVTFAPKNLANVPDGTTCLLRAGRVTAVAYGKPGGTMLVTFEAAPDAIRALVGA